jgi:hypothetical protein
MNSQNTSPELLEEKDHTVPLIMTGLFVGYACICICMCVAIILIWRYSPPTMGLLEPTPTATPLPVPCPDIPTKWVEVMDDKFGPNVHVWPLGRDKNDYEDSDIEIKNGALTFSFKTYKDFHMFYNPQYVASQHNFYLLTKVRQKKGFLNNDYGVTFRQNDTKYYYFAINNAGEVLIYKRIDDEDHPWEKLYYMPSSSVQPGKYNELTVIAQDSHFIFCVNQQMVTEMDDNSYVSGEVGIGMNLMKANDEVVIEYDNYTMYGPYK